MRLIFENHHNHGYGSIKFPRILRTMDKHAFYLHRCQVLANIAAERQESPVGSLLVLEKAILGEGVESTKASQDVSRHSEILAIQDAITRGHTTQLHLATLYTTHEPCIMCSYVIRHHRIPVIVFQHEVPHIGGYSSSFRVLQTTDVPHWGPPPEVIQV